MNDYEWSWGDEALDRLIQAFELAGDIQKLVLTFRTSEFPTLTISYADGSDEVRKLHAWGIKQIGPAFDFPWAYQEAIFTVERGRFVESWVKFVPRQDPIDKIIAALKEGQVAA